jgi:hypothetical protein
LTVTVAVNVTGSPATDELAEAARTVVVEATGGAPYTNRSAAAVALVPVGVVTVISTVPVPAGEVAVIEVALGADTLVADVDPNFTVASTVKFVPVMVTTVPPAVGPLLGLTPVTVGGP